MLTDEEKRAHDIRPIKFYNGIVDHLNDLKCDPDSEWSTPQWNLTLILAILSLAQFYYLS